MSAPLTPEDADLLAGEYVLGVLDSADRARAEDLAKTDASFAARIAAWQDRLAPMTDEIAPVPAPDLMPQINARLFGAPKGFWQRLFPESRFGQLVAGVLGTGVMAAIAVLAVAALLQFSGGIDRTFQSATLAATNSDVQFHAQLDGQVVTIRQTSGAAPAAGRSYELWIIEGDAAPVSLGLIEGRTAVALPAAAKGYVLAITDEPFGGGPGGKPSGAVIAAGSFPEI